MPHNEACSVNNTVTMSSPDKAIWVLIGLGAAFYLPFLGGVHLFDWDEINFAEISREMLLTGEFFRPQINYMPFWEKPPLFFWLQALAMSVFGIGEYAARLPNALTGIATLVILYLMGRRLHSHRFGFIWAGVYFGSVLPFLYFKSGIIDPLFNLFIFSGIYVFILGVWKRRGLRVVRNSAPEWSYMAASGALIGLAMLTKGQAGFLIAALTIGVYWISRRFAKFVTLPQLVLFSVVAVLVTGFWYGAETLRNGPWFVTEFVTYQIRLFSTPDAGHGGFPGYHVVVLLFGVFPASIFAIRAFGALPPPMQLHQRDMLRWMKVLFFVVLVLFSVVQSKIVHYSSLCYFPMTYLAAVVISHLISGQIRLSNWMRIMLLLIGGLFVIATLALPVVGRQAAVLAPLFDDPFARGNLEAAVTWPWATFLPGLFLIGIMVAFFGLYARKNVHAAFSVLFGGTAIFVMLSLIAFIGRIEAFSQRAAIEFFEDTVAETDAYKTVYGYKSYAHLFYGNRRPTSNPELTYLNDSLIFGTPDKDVYIVTKIHKADALRAVEGLREIGGKNGFVFFVREREKPSE